MRGCLSRAELVRYHARELGELEARLVTEHLGGCIECSRRSATLYQEHEEDMARIREAVLAESEALMWDSPAARLEVTPQGRIGEALDAQPTEATDLSIEGYDIIGEIHRGGQGVVYEGFHQATKRRVAIKIMREGMFPQDQDQPRREREVRILAQLDHPNIVKIHDCGTTAGHFYYVMDYIAGQALEAWAATTQRGPDDSLRLFAKICDAVNAAHLRGILHRDLKPGNIIVDDNGEPHVLDFGLARAEATGSAGEPESLAVTVTGHFIGSAPWASPEQAEGIPGKIDIRTDVYSLGVILYQLLTGRFPYDVSGGMRKVLNNILNAEPARPSTICRHIGHEVETIVLKCLSKEPARRYQTAGELDRDIRHYLAGEPIEAKRDSVLYVLRKQVQRHRGAVAVVALVLMLLVGRGALVAAGLVVALLVGLAVITSIQARRNRRLAEREQAQRLLTEQQRSVADDRLYVARMNLAQQAFDEDNILYNRDLLSRYLPADGRPDRDVRGLEWYYLWRQGHSDLMTIWAHADRVQAVAFSPDGKSLASATSGGVVRVWDAVTGRQQRALLGHLCEVTDVAFAPDGKVLASASGDGTVRLWDAATGREQLTFAPHRSAVEALAYSPDGQLLVTAGADGLVVLCDPATGAVRTALRGHVGRVLCVAFSPDGETLASGGEDGLRLWNHAASEQIAKPPAPDLGGFHVSALAFSPDGQWLAVGRDHGSVDLYDVTRQVWIEKHAHRPHWREVMDVAFSPDGTVLASVGGDRALRLWHVDRDAEHVLTGVPATIKEHTGCVSAVAFAPDGEHVVTGSWDRTVKFWDVQRQLRSGLAPIGVSGVESGYYVNSLSFSADGQTLATGGFQVGVELWDVRTGQRLRCLVEPEPLRWTLAQLSGDGHTLVVWDPSWQSRGRIEVWHVPTKTRIDIPHDGRRHGYLGGVALSPDGNIVASGAKDGTVTLWRASTGTELAVIRASSACVTALAFSHDGRRLATGSRDCSVRLWDVRDERNPVALQNLERGDFEDPIDADGIAFSPDDRLLAAIASDGTIRVWDVATRRWHVDLEGTSRDAATSAIGPRISFAPDSRVLATVATDVELIKLWDLKTGLERGTFRGSPPPDHPIRAIAFCSTDGRTLAAGSRGYFTLLKASSREQVRRRRYPDRAVASRRRARSAQVLGKVDEAIALFEEALAQFQDLLGDDNLWAAETMLDLGLLLSEEPQPERLVRAEAPIFSAHAVIQAKLPAAHEWRLRALEALCALYRPDRLNKPEGIAAIESSLAEPAIAEALTAQGLSMWRRPEDRTKAISTYRRAITLCPDTTKAHYRLAWAQSELGAHGEAMSALVEAVELDPRVALEDGCKPFFLLADSFTATVKSGRLFSSSLPQQLGALRKLHDVLAQGPRFLHDRAGITARMTEVEAMVQTDAVPQ